MTDVLELLLREPEEDENRWEYPWNTAGLSLKLVGIAGKTGLQMEQTQRTMGTDLPNERDLPVQIRADQPHPLSGAQTKQGAAWSISDRMRHLHQAAQRREKSSVRPDGPVGSGSGNDIFLAHGRTEQRRRADDFAARVDAVFARDARRYDGPLRLL